MLTPHEIGRRASLFVLFVALAYSGYIYLSGDFGGMGFILRLTKNPMAYAWPVLRMIFVVQVLIGFAAIVSWKRPRILRWVSLGSICLAVLTQTVLLVSCITLEFDSSVQAGPFALPLTALIAVLLIACLVFSLTRTEETIPS